MPLSKGKKVARVLTQKKQKKVARERHIIAGVCILLQGMRGVIRNNNGPI